MECSSPHWSLSLEGRTVAVKLRKPEPPESLLQESEARGLGAPNALTDLLKVIAMQPNEIAECCPRLAAADRWLASVDAPFGFQRPFLRVLAAKKGVVDILPLPSDLDPRRPRFELGKGRHGACAPCALTRLTGAKIVAPWRR